MNDYKVTIKDAFEPIIIEEKTFTRKIEALNHMSKAFDIRDNIIVQMSLIPAAYELTLTKKTSDGRNYDVYIDHSVTIEEAHEILAKYAEDLVRYNLTRS